MGEAIRTCVVCRKRADKRELLRLVVSGDEAGGSLWWDREHSMTGRGCYVHAERECTLGLSRRGLLQRALRGAVFGSMICTRQGDVVAHIPIGDFGTFVERGQAAIIEQKAALKPLRL